MAFDAAILAYVEEALSGCFNYHQDFDNFIVRSGVPNTFLLEARRRADERAKSRPSGAFIRAPKRFVAQELLAVLAHRGDEGDKLISNMITAFMRTSFKDATAAGQEAVRHLKLQIDADKAAKRERETQREEENRRQQAEQDNQREKERTAQEAKRQKLRQAFLDVSLQTNPQARGFAFEKFLVELFESESLQPHGSFRIAGEQIDGSLIWRGGTHLTEAKWTEAQVSGADFGAFSYKIEGKTADTRGLFIAINGYTESAIRSLNGKGALRFVCLDGAHLIRAFEPGWSLKRILEIVWRHADETGEAYLPVSRFPA